MPLACRNLNFAAPLSLKCLESWQDKHGKVAPSKLTDGELFVLVAYALDVRKKDSGLSWDMNFSSRLSRVVRRQPDSIDKETSTCLRYFNDALEKCLTLQPQTLY